MDQVLIENFDKLETFFEKDIYFTVEISGYWSVNKHPLKKIGMIRYDEIPRTVEDLLKLDPEIREYYDNILQYNSEIDRKKKSTMHILLHFNANKNMEIKFSKTITP